MNLSLRNIKIVEWVLLIIIAIFIISPIAQYNNIEIFSFTWFCIILPMHFINSYFVRRVSSYLAEKRRNKKLKFKEYVEDSKVEEI